MKILNEMKLEFISKSSNEGFARIAVASFIAQLDPTVTEVMEVKTAVSEAVTNSIVHGYRDTAGKIYITARIIKDGRIIITIRDRGDGIDDISKARTPLYTSLPDEERSGMGFTIMESFMDRVHVWSKKGMGTRVTLEKKLG